MRTDKSFEVEQAKTWIIHERATGIVKGAGSNSTRKTFKACSVIRHGRCAITRSPESFFSGRKVRNNGFLIA